MPTKTKRLKPEFRFTVVRKDMSKMPSVLDEFKDEKEAIWWLKRALPNGKYRIAKLRVVEQPTRPKSR